MHKTTKALNGNKRDKERERVKEQEVEIEQVKIAVFSEQSIRFISPPNVIDVKMADGTLYVYIYTYVCVC